MEAVSLGLASVGAGDCRVTDSSLLPLGRRVRADAGGCTRRPPSCLAMD